MKKTIALMMAAVSLAACHEADESAANSTFIVTGYSNADPATRTAFGMPDGSYIPYSWTKGDYIWSGIKSRPITEDCLKSDFIFDGTETGETDIFYNMTGERMNAYVLASQTADGNLGNDGDFGYAQLNTANNTFCLSHKTSYVWFNVTTQSADLPKLISITFTAASSYIAGKCVFDFANDRWEEAIIDGSKSITLSFGDGIALQKSYEGVMAAMVCLPATINSEEITITYTFENQCTYTEVRRASKNLEEGKTLRISTSIASDMLVEPAPEYELRYLTFEDEDAKFAPYTLDYADAEITTWSDLIDDPEYNGPLCYGDYMSCEYTWYDEGNTELTHTFPYNYYAYCYWGGGHAVSNYASTDYVNYGTYENQLRVYGEEGAGGHNGSANFCMHFGYKDGSPYNGTDYLPALRFFDGEARVIDHMYVNNSAYAINCYMNGNGLTANIDDEDWVKLIAIGYDADGNETGTVEFYMVDGPNRIITEWTKWDLSSLGAVVSIEFNVTGSSDNGYGYSQPAYFAYDDLAVRFDR